MDFVIQPIIESPADLVSFGVSADAHAGVTTRYAKFMQAVVGVPEHPQFQTPEFDPVRDAFTSACMEAASGYVTRFENVLNARDFGSALAESTTTTKSDQYESNCLVQLDAIPLPIRRVTGVLAIRDGDRWATFCSATINGPKSVVTSRHCFFDADSGNELATWSHLDNAVEFHALAPHAGSTLFSVRKLTSTLPVPERFDPPDDMIELRVLEGPFEHMAKPPTAALAAVPAPIWLVGNNALLGDVTRQRRPLEYVRASSPHACSVVHATESGCLFHTCQAGNSTSGAGLLALAGDEVTLLGVHKGPSSRGEACKAGIPTDLVLNLAAQWRSAP